MGGLRTLAPIAYASHLIGQATQGRTIP